MCLTASYLCYYVVLQTDELLRKLDCIFFISAKILNQVCWEAELSAFCATPAVDSIFFCESEGVEASASYLLDFLAFKVSDSLGLAPILAIILTCLVHRSPTKQLLIFVYGN